MKNNKFFFGFVVVFVVIFVFFAFFFGFKMVRAQFVPVKSSTVVDRSVGAKVVVARTLSNAALHVLHSDVEVTTPVVGRMHRAVHVATVHEVDSVEVEGGSVEHLHV